MALFALDVAARERVLTVQFSDLIDIVQLAASNLVEILAGNPNPRAHDAEKTTYLIRIGVDGMSEQSSMSIRNAKT